MYIKADALNRKAKSHRNYPEDVVHDLKIKEGMHVLDLGTGGGFFTLRISEVAGENGRVIAADTDEKMLGHVAEYALLFKRKNIELLQVEADRVNVPEQSLDLIFCRNTFHHLENHVAYFEHLRALLKPGGRIAILDKQPKKSAILRRRKHFTADAIAGILYSAGYQCVQKETYLPKQSFQIFAPVEEAHMHLIPPADKIKNVVFDLGNVLLRFEPKRMCDRLFQDKGVCERIVNVVFGTEEWLALDRGTMTEEEARECFKAKVPDLEEEIDLVMDVWYGALTPIKEHIALLDELKKKGYQLYVLSNFHDKAYQEMRRRHSFFEYFDGIVISAYIHLLKPEPEIYDHLLKTQALQPEETLFIDDALDNIKAAEGAGITGIHCKESIDLKEVLQKCLLEHNLADQRLDK